MPSPQLQTAASTFLGLIHFKRYLSLLISLHGGSPYILGLLWRYSSLYQNMNNGLAVPYSFTSFV
ncbi:hypothetical protein BDV97DRAFT_361641 [Delphinella strobiligena]|nr:hypothetical protein BDV97DRAFT_361641 [Delphinella strobiligena]